MSIFKKKTSLVRVLAKGGILTPSYFLNITKIAKQLGNSTIHFGSRQDILFHVKEEDILTIDEAFKELKIDYIIQNDPGLRNQNIVSSYVSVDVLPTTSWVNSGTYLYVLENIDFNPRLRVNIVDPAQNLVPLFYGHINFVASKRDKYWYLYLRLPNTTELVRWPVLVYSSDIPALIQMIDNLYFDYNIQAVNALFAESKQLADFQNENITEELKFTDRFFPNYEGIHKMSSGQNYWAGFFWRNNAYDIHFIDEICLLCLRTGNPKISLTPWKSFLVKDIKSKDRIEWERVIGRFGINMHHSSFELNWHLPLLNKRALDLKRYIVKEFDKVDVRTFGLTFSIKEKNEIPFTSIIIQESPFAKFYGPFHSFKTYTISHAVNFNPNHSKFEVYAEGVVINQVPKVLIEMTKIYYSQLNAKAEDTSRKEFKNKAKLKNVYYCKSCLTVYDDAVGDPVKGIAAGVHFAMLPKDYTCQTCDAAIENFTTKEISVI